MTVSLDLEGLPSHPSWCVRHYCTANPVGRSGAHRSRPVLVGPPKLTANLYAGAVDPDLVMIEIHASSVLLPAADAYGLGRILVSLGKMAGERRG